MSLGLRLWGEHIHAKRWWALDDEHARAVGRLYFIGGLVSTGVMVWIAYSQY